jgi:hypothetical protein
MKADRWEGELRHTTKGGNQITVASRWTTLRDRNGKAVGWLESNTDLTARKRAEEAARSLSGRILSAALPLSDAERRSRFIFRAVKYCPRLSCRPLAILRCSSSCKVASESAGIADKCLTETRTISYLSHPPMLDEAGFDSAARWYVDGFSPAKRHQGESELPAKTRSYA